MYLSHPVRRLRTDPRPDATVRLVVELDPDDPSMTAGPTATTDASGGSTESNAGSGPLGELRTVVEGAGGRIGRDLGFDTHLVVVPETAVDDVCSVSGVARVETDATITLDVADATPTDDDDVSVDVDTLRDHLDEE